MLRSKLIASLVGYLQANYTGSIPILPQESDADLFPPCAIVRVGSAEDMGYGQAEIWDMNVLIGVFHDADASSASSAEAEAAKLFATLADTDAVFAALDSAGILPSAWLPLSIEASSGENGWQHIAGYRCIAAPPRTDD